MNHGSPITTRSTSKISFGMNEMVASWIWVMAWEIPTTKPITNPAIRKGNDSTIICMKALEISSVIWLVNQRTEKLESSMATTRFQPSTITNKRSLNGRLTTAGGSMMSPIVLQRLATTISRLSLIHI